MKIKFRLWLIMIISPIVSVVLFIPISNFIGDLGNSGYDLNSLATISTDLLDTIEQQPDFHSAEIASILSDTHSKYPDIRFEWIAADGSTIYDTLGKNVTYTFQQLADRMLYMPENLWGDDEPITLTYSLSQFDQSYYLLMSMSSDAMKEGQFYFYMRTFTVLSVFILPLFVVFLVPYLFSLWFFSSTNKRLKKLNYAIGKLNIQSDISVLEDKEKDEIGELTTHYNAMVHRLHHQAEQILQFDKRRKLLLSNLSHDLRTPLTMVLGYAETIRAGLYKDDKELQASAKVILQRSRYMDRLLDQLLDITRQDEGNIEPHIVVHNLSEMMRKIAADYIMFLEGQNITVEVNIPDEDIEIGIDASLMERAVRNLLDNAIRYGADGNYFEIAIFEKDNIIFIRITDRGIGIPLSEQEHIFERFYRVNSSRKGEGLGIGLSIVKEIITLHNGSISLLSVPCKETTFEIQLPKSKRDI